MCRQGADRIAALLTTLALFRRLFGAPKPAIPIAESIFAPLLVLSGARSDSWACLKPLQVSLHLFGILGPGRSHQNAKINAPISLLETFGSFARFRCYRPIFPISGNAENRLTIWI
jgi:hypothetical protein